MASTSHRNITVRAGVHRSHVYKHTKKLADFVSTLYELHWNSLDANAKSIRNRFYRDKEGYHWSVWDDGTGLTDKGLEAIVSLDFSPSAGEPGKRGRNGNGAKGFVHHCESLHVLSRRPGKNEVYEIEYTPDQLIDMWEGSGEGCWTVRDVNTLADPRLFRVSGSQFTLRNLGKGPGVNPKHDRTVARVIEELSKKFIPSHAEMITIQDDVLGKTHKLKHRPIIGTRVEGGGTIPRLGAITYDIVIVPDPDLQHDKLMLWAYDPICPVTDMLSRIRPTQMAIATLLRTILTVLGHPQVVGKITFQRLNEFLLSDRATIAEDFFDDSDLIYELVRFIHAEILPKVEKNIDKDVLERMRGSDLESMTASIVEICAAAGSPVTKSTDHGHDDSKTPRANHAIQVSQAVLELECGMTFAIEVKNPKEGLTYRWDAQDSGCSIDRLLGTRISGTAGQKQGLYRLIVSDGENKRVISISITARLPLKFATRNRHGAPGETLVHTLVNTHRTTGKFLFILEETGEQLPARADGLSVAYKHGDVEGECSISAIEMNVPEGRTAERCRVYITISNKPLRDGAGPSATSWKYRDEYFDLLLTEPIRSDQTVIIPASLGVGITGSANKIVLNTSAPGFHGPIDMQRQFALTHIALRMAQVFVGKEGVLDPNEGMERLQTLAAEIFAELIAKKRKLETK